MSQAPTPCPNVRTARRERPQGLVVTSLVSLFTQTCRVICRMLQVMPVSHAAIVVIRWRYLLCWRLFPRVCRQSDEWYRYQSPSSNQLGSANCWQFRSITGPMNQPPTHQQQIHAHPRSVPRPPESHVPKPRHSWGDDAQAGRIVVNDDA